MKRMFLKMICAALALCSVLAFASCGDGKSSATETTTAPATTAVPSITAPQQTTSGDVKKETDLSKLHGMAEKGDLFSGSWKITEGAGSKLESFVFQFDGDGNAYLMVDTMGFIGTYAIKAENNQDLFITQLMFGLNGKYTYQFSKDKSSVVLTNIKDKTTSTLVKTDSYSCIPAAEDSPSIDEKLLGAWADGNGGYLYFDKKGIMYETQKGLTFTFYNYNAKDGTVTATYKMKTETTETAKYSVKDDTLTYKDYEYKRVSADELP